MQTRMLAGAEKPRDAVCYLEVPEVANCYITNVYTVSIFRSECFILVLRIDFE